MRWYLCPLFCLLIGPFLLSPLAVSAPEQVTVESRTFLDNGQLKVGCDLALGGAITYLATPKKANMVNSWDLGRQIQMAYYSGPVPLIVNGKRPAPMWVDLGWNPIQSGDHYRNASRVLGHKNDGKTIYVKCVPKLWPFDNIPAECVFEMEVRLDGPAVRLKCRLTNARGDKTLYPARDQELPAVYLNGAYYRLFAYTGDRPFSGAALTRVVKQPKTPGPWAHFSTGENWAALVDDDDFGVAVWHPGIYSFVGGFAGKPGKGGPYDTDTGYVAPRGRLMLDHNIVHEYRCALVVGSLAEVRKYVANRSVPAKPPLYRFSNDRQGWTHTGFSDTGWPIRGQLRLTMTKTAAELIGPEGFWQAKDASRLTIHAAMKTKAKQGRLYWATHDQPRFDAKRSVAFDIVGDGVLRAYGVPLAGLPGYTGSVTQVRVDPIVGGDKGDTVEVQSIGFMPETSPPSGTQQHPLGK